MTVRTATEICTSMTTMEMITESWLWLLNEEQQEFEKYWFVLENLELSYYDVKGGELKATLCLEVSLLLRQHIFTCLFRAGM